MYFYYVFKKSLISISNGTYFERGFGEIGVTALTTNLFNYFRN